ncbi:MAG TPA: ABC transporter permease, partial [Longimicrobium sp.]|nr:ABC transporter permease [Longimicrobium sp.]
MAAAREALRGVFSPGRADAEMDEELRFHLDMETERLVREEGLDPREARRRAAVAFGGVEKVREEVRDARGLAWVAGMRLDFKLGLRMLAKHPGLTVVGGLAIAFAIAVGAASFEAVGQLLHPRLPLDEGDRVVGIRNWDARASRVRPRATADFVAWRGGLRTVEELGAFRTVERNLITGDGGVEPVSVAEMTASGFRVARVPPLLGRALVDADEAPGAPPVVVLGHRAWRTRFGGDPAVVGRTLRLGRERSTIVGVMPEGFAFPVSHALWVPFRAAAGGIARGEGPAVQLFGRLAPGASLDEARAELATVGRRAAADFPETHRHLRPEVLPYAESILPVRFDGSLRAGLWSIVVFFAVFVGLACANVATLVFARTAAREGEIVVRTALGASRGRIVAQLFAEALVLAGVAIVVGLAGASAGLRWATGMMASMLQAGGHRMPSWIGDGLSPTTIAYAVGLAVVGAVVAGVLPGLKVTGRQAQASLQRAGGRGSGVRLGGVWTGIIVTQVALTVMLVPVAVVLGLQTWEMRTVDH